MCRVEDLAEDLEQRMVELAPEGIPVISRYPVGHGAKTLSLLLDAEHSSNKTSFTLALQH